jgi:tRNA(Ile)-lysidine synthase
LSRLLAAGQGLLIAVSGGRDSMVLLHALHALREAGDDRMLVAAHLNHRLRGEESDRDAALVEAVCRRLDILLDAGCCEPGELEAACIGSLEESARKTRYEYLLAAAARHGLTTIATAHHADDQAETVLFNLLRGTGLRGLCGIPERRAHSTGHVQIIRPLLQVPSRQLADYATASAITFAVDQSNLDLRFARNRVRNEIMPLVAQAVNPRAGDSLRRLADQASEVIACLDELADRLLASARTESNRDACRLRVELLRREPEYLVRHLFQRLWIMNQWSRQDMSAWHWHRLARLVTQDQVNSIDLPSGVRAERTNTILRILRDTSRQPAEHE